MCGVVARLGKGDISESLKRLEHRGIRSKVKETRSGSIGHVRLPIVGLGEEFDQPISSSPWTIAFVGEILDYKETHPHFECDLQLVEELWRTSINGHTFGNHDGFWSIVAMDANSDTLHLLCDYLGQKPLYYRKDVPSAASEPDALLPMGPVSWDEVYFSAVRKWGYCPDLRRTPYNEIKHVLPGEYVVLYQNGFCVRDIVDPIIPIQCSEQDIANEIDAAVRRRVLSSDVPVAALVSGGVDSSIVYTLAMRYGYGDVVPYHTTSNGAVFDQDELRRATDLVHPEILNLSAPDVTLAEALAAFQEPIDLGSLTQQMALAKSIDERVCLTGDGADELFGGYGRASVYDSQYSDTFQELPAWHLPRLDRIMMKTCVEVRSPFLARGVVARALGLPWERRRNKNALREMFRDTVREEFLNAPKIPMKTTAVEMSPIEYREIVIAEFKRIKDGKVNFK